MAKAAPQPSSHAGADPRAGGGPGGAKPRQRASGYIRTLDGWRAIAIWAVIFYHSRLTHLGPLNVEGLRNFCDHGVQLFFAISGILICSRLLEEKALHGQISLKNFYIRRLFRIQPAAICYLSLVGFLGLIGVIHESLPAWLSSLFCLRNLHAAANWPDAPGDRYTVHFWSLAVEEHFYLLLPVLLTFARRKSIRLLGALSFLFFFWAPIADHLGIASTPLSAWRTDIALRYLLFPAFLAALIAEPHWRTRFSRYTLYQAPVFLVVAGVLVSHVFLHGHGTNELCCLGFPFMVLSTMLHPYSWLGTILEKRLFTFMGRISYSLYLWQQLFFLRRDEFSALKYIQNSPWNLIWVLACAIVSYYLIEKPLMRIGHRLAPGATPGRIDLAQNPGI